MNWRVFFRWLLAVFFIVAGAAHFRSPEVYVAMMPLWLSKPLALVYVSGAAEILGGIGVLVPFTRRFAGWGLVVLLIAVFPANVHVALLGRMPGSDLSPLLLWLRLPVQFGLIAWAWWAAVAPQRDETLD